MSEPIHPTRDTLALLLRAELDAATEQRVTTHLRACTACAQALREEAVLDVALLQAHASAPDETASELDASAATPGEAPLHVTARDAEHVEPRASEQQQAHAPRAAPSARSTVRNHRTRRALWTAGAALAAGATAWLLSAQLRAREGAPATPATADTAALCLARPDDAACQATQGAATPAPTEGPAEPAPSNFGVEVR